MLRTFVTIAGFGYMLAVPVTVQEPGRFPTARGLVCREDRTGISILSDYIPSDELVNILQRLPEPPAKISFLMCLSFSVTGSPTSTPDVV